MGKHIVRITLLPVIMVVALVASMSAGIAHAASYQPSSRSVGGAVAADPAGSAAAASALAPCTTPLPPANGSCASTSPLVDRWWDASAAASSCTVRWTIDWGDGSQIWTGTFADESPGQHLLASHTYDPSIQKTYTETLTSSIVSGPCSGAATYYFKFTLLAYVALGDSYSSGLGAGDYNPLSGNCYQSHLAYPNLVNTRLRGLEKPPPIDTAFVFKPCNGAVVDDFFTSEYTAAPQISYLEGIPAHSVGLVTLTIGGNDLGFRDFMEYCAQRSSGDPSCQAHGSLATDIGLAFLPGKLAFLFSKIKGEQSLAPGARVLVLGYPEFFTSGQPTGCPTGDPFGKHTFLSSDMTYIDKVIQQLDTDISSAATAAGFTYVNTLDAFSGHQLCEPDPWLNAATLLKDGVWVSASFHPNSTGQKMFATLVEQALSLR